jgi:hypothetical protein
MRWGSRARPSKPPVCGSRRSGSRSGSSTCSYADAGIAIPPLVVEVATGERLGATPSATAATAKYSAGDVAGERRSDAKLG